MIQLNDLGEDIILSHIIQYLNSDDIISLSLTSHHFHEILSTNEAYHKLYLKLFGSKPVPLNLNNYDWKTLFNLRVSKRAKFYTWGSQSNFRLGHAAPDASDEFRNFVGCSIPHPVEGVEDLILTNITSGGFSFQMLTINGELFWTGTRWSMSNSTLRVRVKGTMIPKIDQLGM